MIKKIILLIFLTLFMSISTQSTFCKENEAIKMNEKTREEICKINFEKLFKTKWNPNAGQNPDMMSILQKYIFADIFNTGNLNDKTREMITITTLTCQQTLPQLKAHIQAALNINITPTEIRETIYQCAPIIGFPKTLNAIEAMNDVFIKNNIELPIKNTSTTNEENRYLKGKEIQNTLYKNEILNKVQNLPNNLGYKIDKMLTEVYFGDFYTRKGLTIKQRELLILVAIISTDNFDILKNHIEANIKIGNNKETTISAIIQCMPYIGFPKAIKALNYINNTEENDLKQPFKKGEINPYSEFFTGETHLNMLVNKDDIWNSSIGNVTFKKGARTNWHKHSGGQILLVTAGEGRYQEKNKKMQILKQGDVVKIPPNIIHWHGASPNQDFSHISIETNIPNNTTTWLKPVTEKEYKKEL